VGHWLSLQRPISGEPALLVVEFSFKPNTMMVTGYGFDAQTVFDTEVPKGHGIRPAAQFLPSKFFRRLSSCFSRPVP